MNRTLDYYAFCLRDTRDICGGQLMKKMFAYLSALFFLLACWQGSSVLLDKAFLPDVGATIVSFGENWLNGALPQALMISLRRIFWGIFWAVILAVPFGLA